MTPPNVLHPSLFRVFVQTHLSALTFSAGVKGEQGLMGVPGVIGVHGDRGPSGPKGNIGATGLSPPLTSQRFCLSPII